MEVTTKRFQILIDGEPVFLQGMNLFLDPFVLERNPRKILHPEDLQSQCRATNYSPLDRSRIELCQNLANHL